MEKVTITLELTLEEARFVLNEIEQFRYAKQEANKQQPEPQPEHSENIVMLGKINQLPEQEFWLKAGKKYEARNGMIFGPLEYNEKEKVYKFEYGGYY